MARKPLSLDQYYARLAQRLIAAVSAPTAEGVLYEVDMRLRPSGSKGPVAASLAQLPRPITATQPGPGRSWR